MGLSNILSANANFNGIATSRSAGPSLHVSEFVHKVSINMRETSAVEREENRRQCMADNNFMIIIFTEFYLQKLQFYYIDADFRRFEGIGPELDSADVWLSYNINRPFVFLITTPSKIVFIGKYMG